MELLDDMRRNPPAIGDLDPPALRPFPDRLVLRPVDPGRRTRPARRGGGDPTPADPARGQDELRQRSAPFLRVPGGQVNLLTRALQAEPQRLIGLTPVGLIREVQLEL